jgi:hypothetical protein
MLAGPATRDCVVQHLNGILNVMNLESNAHTEYDDLGWGIEAIEPEDNNGKVNESRYLRCYLPLFKVKYIYRNVPSNPSVGPGFIRLTDGQEIEFGNGPDGERLGKGPLPLLCNLRLAVTRVLKMSGAAEVIT